MTFFDADGGLALDDGEWALCGGGVGRGGRGADGGERGGGSDFGDDALGGGGGWGRVGFLKRSGAWKLISSSTRSRMVWRRRAPMFSVVSLTRKANWAISCDGFAGELEPEAFGLEHGGGLLDEGSSWVR